MWDEMKDDRSYFPYVVLQFNDDASLMAYSMVT